MYAIAVHGGAGSWSHTPRKPALAGVEQAAEVGRQILEKGGSALDAVTEAVRVFEDDPLFNAGTGSVLNFDGDAEMDAGIMVGSGLRTGGVAALRRVRNPILVARKVMEMTDHVLLGGSGALRFARAVGFADYDPVTLQRRKNWQRHREDLEAKQGDDKVAALHTLLSTWPREDDMGTVGAVALDRQGELAAGTSTGGVTLKLPGRIGDSPLPGAGNYATPHAAVSATGRGELMMRFLTAKVICDDIWNGHPANKAVERVLREMGKCVGEDVGVIALDSEGDFGIHHLTPAMPHAWVREGSPAIEVRMTT
ncbi:isoaspartyl peptidase/L-asparaginase family protein [Thiohalomonas denitrificans]|uniref:Isoaspartyl peptidase n=1 Tax=Thiohalomonas denitrificans TaxID=415747 RepID=A0A1G5QFF0_9GAMM|nr:isoaspartyl peptidase/L-asparaginase [Thiohalomonas denitrificans]SCZ60260.1 asparaginase [Thiohalomonas denitrificans]